MHLLCRVGFISLYQLHYYAAAFSGKHNVTVWRPSVGQSVPSALRWPSVPDFPEQSRFLTTCPEKITVIPDAHLSRFWFGALDLSRFAHLCGRMLTHRWPKISSDIICIYDKIKIAGVRVGSSRRSPRPQVRPPIDGSRLRRSHSTSTILVLGACLGLRCPNYGHLSPHNTPGYSMLHNQRTFRPGSARPDNKEDRHTCIHLASTVSISTISGEPDRNQFLRISFFVLTWSSVYLGFRCAVPSEANYCWWLQF